MKGKEEQISIRGYYIGNHTLVDEILCIKYQTSTEITIAPFFPPGTEKYLGWGETQDEAVSKVVRRILASIEEGKEHPELLSTAERSRLRVLEEMFKDNTLYPK